MVVIANAERRYAGLYASFVDAGGHLVPIEEMNQTQPAAPPEGLNVQEDLWKVVTEMPGRPGW